ncbi:MAG: extracellular solute-binding protein [Calditrichia bacterium]
MEPTKKSLSKWAFILITGIATILATLIMIFFFRTNPNSALSDGVTQIYMADNISRAHQILIDKFNAEHSGRIEVVGVDLPFEKFSTNERKELLARSLRGKSDRLDIFAVDLIWVSRFARWAENLDSYFSQSYRETLLPSALESCYFDSSLVALPMYIDIGLMYYRDDLIEKLPNSAEIRKQMAESITWEKLISLKSHVPSNSPIYLFPGKAYEGLVCSFIELVGSQGGSIIEGDSVNLNTPYAYRSLKLLSDLINGHQITPAEVINYDEIQVYNHAIEEDAIFFRGWPGFLEQMDLVDGKYLNIKKTLLPHFAGSIPKSVFGGWNLMISRYSKNIPQAVEFLRFIQRPENQRILFENGGYIPINKLCYQDTQFLKDNPSLMEYKQILSRGFHRPAKENYTQISDILSYYLNQALKKRMTVRDALKKATRQINSKKVMVN